MKQKPVPQVFFKQPKRADIVVEHDYLQAMCANGNTLNVWLKNVEPTIEMLKYAAILEGVGKKRVLILNRLLTRIYKLEKAATLAALTK